MTNPNPMSTSSQGTTMPIEPAAETSATIEESKTSANVDTNDLGVVAKDSSMDSLSDCISKFKTPITSAIQTTTLPVSLVDDALHVRIGAFLLIVGSVILLHIQNIHHPFPKSENAIQYHKELTYCVVPYHLLQLYFTSR